MVNFTDSVQKKLNTIKYFSGKKQGGIVTYYLPELSLRDMELHLSGL